MTAIPPLTRRDLLAFQFSAWYPTFGHLSIKSTVLRPLSADFAEYLATDGVFVPHGADDLPPESTISDDEADDDDGDNDIGPTYAFPELDAQIRAAVKEYGAVFPKLNFSSPRDAAWVVPTLRCTSPADVYLALKSSGFVAHDLAPFEGCVEETGDPESYELELVLRKWYMVEPSRELRCFVRDEQFVAISLRDSNFYDFLNESPTQIKIVNSMIRWWSANIQHTWTGPKSYTFDVLLTRDLSRAHLIDFNPYTTTTDPLLFTYDELAGMSSNQPPVLRVIDSRAHPTAARNAPIHQHNMVPLDALAMSHGVDMDEFTERWSEQIRSDVIN